MGEHIPIVDSPTPKADHNWNLFGHGHHKVEPSASTPGAPLAIVVNTKKKPIHKSTNLLDVFMVDQSRGLLPETWFVPAHYTVDSKHRHIHVSCNRITLQRFALRSLAHLYAG